MRTIIKNNRGASYVQVCVIVLILVMILAAVLFYASAMTIVRQSKEDASLVLDSYVMKNCIEIYNYSKQGNDLNRKLDQKYFLSQYLSRFSLDYSNNMLYSVGEDGETVYRMTVPQVGYEVDKTLNLKAEYNLMIPVRFAGKTLTWMTVPMTVRSALTIIE